MIPEWSHSRFQRSQFAGRLNRMLGPHLTKMDFGAARCWSAGPDWWSLTYVPVHDARPLFLRAKPGRRDARASLAGRAARPPFFHFFNSRRSLPGPPVKTRAGMGFRSQSPELVLRGVLNSPGAAS